MLSRFAYTLLALTSVAPVALVYGASQVFNDNWLALAFIGLTVVLTLLCSFVLNNAKAYGEIEPLNIASIRSANNEVLAFFLTYLLPLLVRGDGNSVGQPLAIIVFIGLLLIVVFRSNLLHVNPLIGLLGYQFFEVTSSNGYTYMLVTKKHTNKLENRRGIELSSTLLLEV